MGSNSKCHVIFGNYWNLISILKLTGDQPKSTVAMSEEESLHWLEELLQETQLQKFFTRIHDDLQVSRLDHFDFVKADDLENIGMGRPAARRLLEAVKRKRRKSIIDRVSWLYFKMEEDKYWGGEVGNRCNEARRLIFWRKRGKYIMVAPLNNTKWTHFCAVSL